MLPECNLNGAPLDVFVAECCQRCINPECTRSQFGGSKFDQRTGTWLQRLFTEVPKLQPNDPRFQAIAGQKFLTIDAGRTPEVRSTVWVDPRDLETASAQVTAPPVVEPTPSLVVATAEAQPETLDPPATNTPQPTPPRKSVPRHMVLANAPSQSGKIIRPETSSAPPKDAWAGPLASPDANITVIKPGATVKLGGSGV